MSSLLSVAMLCKGTASPVPPTAAISVVPCKLGICVHKCEKSGISAGAEIPDLACWWLLPPTPFFADWHLRLRTVPALFEISRYRGLLKIPKIIKPANSKNLKTVLLGRLRFLQNNKARRAAASVKRCPRGMGRNLHQARLCIQTHCLLQPKI